MSAPIGPRRYVSPLDVRVVEYGAASVSVVLSHDHSGTVWMGGATEARALAAHLVAAAEQAEASARAKRAVQRVEEKTRARLHVLGKRATCRGCGDALQLVTAASREDGLCGLCAEARARAQRIVGPAGMVTL